MMRALCGALCVLIAGCTLSVGSVDEDGEPITNGTISGTLRYDAEMPKNPVRDDMGQQRDLLWVDPETKGWGGVVVWLEGDLPEGGSDAAEVVVEQIDFAFQPGVIAVRAGQTVRFTNGDGQNHNVRAKLADDMTAFNVTTAGGHDYETTFRAQPDGKPVKLSCDIHGWMRGWVYVFEHDWFTVTDTTGEFRFEDVPPGKYRLIIEQPDSGYHSEQEVTVIAGSTWTFEQTTRDLPKGSIVRAP